MKLNSALPKSDSFGLGPIARQLVGTPEGVHVIVALVDCSKLTINTDDGATEPTIRVRRVEVISRADLPWARAALRHSLNNRTGVSALDAFPELDADLEAAFGDDVDVNTGEVRTG